MWRRIRLCLPLGKGAAWMHTAAHPRSSATISKILGWDAALAALAQARSRSTAADIVPRSMLALQVRPWPYGYTAIWLYWLMVVVCPCVKGGGRWWRGRTDLVMNNV